MIHILIPLKETSSRFPGKNPLLLPYTLAWASYASLFTPEETTLHTVGDRIPSLPPKLRHIDVSTGSQQGDLQAAEDYLSPSSGDVLVLAQVTQPLRETWLLPAIVKGAREAGASVTASDAPRRAWRALDGQGHWGWGTEAVETPSSPSEPLFLDGTLYAWTPGNLHLIYEPSSPHAVLPIPRRWGLVDIDFAQDMPPALPSMWASLLLE